MRYWMILGKSVLLIGIMVSGLALAGVEIKRPEISKVRVEYDFGNASSALDRFGFPAVDSFEKQEEQEVFHVHWTPGSQKVAKPVLRFLYHQMRSKKVRELKIVYPIDVTHPRVATFKISHAALLEAGRVQGWKVVLEQNGQVLAERKHGAWKGN